MLPTSYIRACSLSEPYVTPKAVQETAAQRTYKAATQESHSGSIYGMGGRFQSFKINDLEMVAQICPRWNRVADWLREAERFSTAA
jgi:hypothetical protein